MGFAYDLRWIGEQLADHDRLMRHWMDVFPGEILEVRYEDVVDDPTRAARRMLDYIGVDWEPGVLDFHLLERPLKTASLWHVRQPLYTRSRGRWQHYREHLQPLLDAMSATPSAEKIRMTTLPEPGWLNGGVDHYRRGDLDSAEYRFKQLLHYVPEHAAARFMLGVIYMHKGHRGAAVELMEQAVERCPWNRRWRRDLGQAYRLAGRSTALADSLPDENAEGRDDEQFLSRELTCTSAVIAEHR
jgi:tetratricopeptide (TPR) repeat protein